VADNEMLHRCHGVNDGIFQIYTSSNSPVIVDTCGEVLIPIIPLSINCVPAGITSIIETLVAVSVPIFS